MAYTTYGDVCRGCGHVHRSIETARACIARHQRACATQGGYSDRQIRVVVTQYDLGLVRHYPGARAPGRALTEDEEVA